MVIGVDAGALAVSDNRLKVGVYRVTLNLLWELSKLDRDNTYILYSFRQIDPGIMRSFGKSFSNRVLRPVWGWFSWRLPLELWLHPPDVFLGLSQALPRLAPEKNIGFVYDLGFVHNPELFPGSAGDLTVRTEYLMRQSQKIVTISQAVKAELEARYRCRSESITVCHPGVNAGFYKSGPATKRKRPYFLFVGALKPGKNVPNIIRGLSWLNRIAGLEYDLLLVGGDYWWDKQIPEIIAAETMEKFVHKIGVVSDYKLAALYRGAVALVTPTLSEGFCLPVVEAMACGTPVIGADTPVFTEIIGTAGLLADPGNPQAIGRAMRKLLNRQTWNKYRDLGIKESEKYRWDKFAERIYGLYRQ